MVWLVEALSVLLTQVVMLVQAHALFFLGQVLTTRKENKPRVPRVCIDLGRAKSRGGKDPLITVALCAMNEEHTIGAALRGIQAAAHSPEDVEIVVGVDEASTDATASVALGVARQRDFRIPLTVVHAKGGRGCVLNAAAAKARGQLLTFLHADTLLPPGFDRVLGDAFSSPVDGKPVLMTAFEFGFDFSQLKPRERVPVGLGLIARCINIRTRNVLMPYGDQALTLPRQVLDAYGAFPDWPLMEDFDMMARMRTEHLRGNGVVRILPHTARCSPRRWMQHGASRVVWYNQYVLLRFRFGATPHELYKFYYGRTYEDRWREAQHTRRNKGGAAE